DRADDRVGARMLVAPADEQLPVLEEDVQGRRVPGEVERVSRARDFVDAAGRLAQEVVARVAPCGDLVIALAPIEAVRTRAACRCVVAVLAAKRVVSALAVECVVANATVKDGIPVPAVQ